MYGKKLLSKQQVVPGVPPPTISGTVVPYEYLWMLINLPLGGT